MDTNGNGLIEWNEFMTFFGEGQGALSKSKAPKGGNEAALRMSTRFLQDEDLAGQLQHKTESQYNEIQTAFKLLDQDGSGMVSPDELRKVMDRFTLPMSDRQLDQFLAGFKRDFEGNVSWRDVLADWGGKLAGNGLKGGVRELKKTAKRDLRRRDSYNRSMLGNKAWNRPGRAPAPELVKVVKHPEQTRDNTQERLLQLRTRLSLKLSTKWDTMQDAFRFADTDKNNSLTIEEMRRLFDREDLIVNDADFALLQHRLSEGSNEVSFAAFSKFFSQSASEEHGYDAAIEDRHGEVNHWVGDVQGRQEGHESIELGGRAGTRKEATIPLVGADQANKLLIDKMALQFSQVRSAFQKYDIDRSGAIGLEEFRGALANFNICLSDPELRKLMARYDMDSSGSVDYREFMDCFGTEINADAGSGVDKKIQDQHGASKGPDFRGKQTAGKTQGHISRREIWQSADAAEAHLLNKLVQQWSQVGHAFRHFDQDKNGLISEQEFRQVLGGLGINVKPSECTKLLHRFDIDLSGGLDYNEFVGQFGKVMQPGEGGGGVQSDIQGVQKKHNSAEAWKDGKQHGRVRTPALERQLAHQKQVENTLQQAMGPSLDPTIMMRPGSCGPGSRPSSRGGWVTQSRPSSRGGGRTQRHSQLMGGGTSRPSTVDWVHTARSVRSLQAQVTRNIPFISQRLAQMDLGGTGKLPAEDFVVALVDAGVDIGSQVELANLAGRWADGDGPTASVNYRGFIGSMGHSETQNKEQEARHGLMKGFKEKRQAL